MSTPHFGPVVFAHDHLFHQEASGAWYSRGGQFSAALWDRYLQYCSRLVVVARCSALSPLEDPSRLSACTREGVSFVPVASLAGLGKRVRHAGKARRAATEAVRGADLVIARLPSQTGLLAIEVAEQLGKPWVVECVGCAWDAHRHHASARAKLYAPIARRQMRSAIERAAVVMYVTERFLQGRYPTRGVSVACSDVDIEIDAAPSQLERRIQRIQTSKSERPLRLGLIGSFSHRHKGVEVALRALHEAKQQLPAFELCVLGPGDPGSALALARRLDLGAVFQPDAALPRGPAVQAWLDEVDVYLQPSRYEAMPRALIEAMARGCPALASDTGGIAELLPADCLHPPGDHARLSAQLIAAAGSAWQLQHARRNLEHARRFERAALAAKRGVFWQAVRDVASTPKAT